MGPGNKTSRRTDARPLVPGLEIILAAALTVGALVCLAVAEGAELTLAWVDNSGGAAGVKIERKLATDATFVEVAAQAPGVVSYTDATVVSGATYCYRVKAYNEAGESAYSSEACGTSGAALEVLEVTVRTRGTGRGSVRRNPNGSPRVAGDSTTHPIGTVVTLTATPEAGSVFLGWSGGGCRGTESCTVTGNGTITVTATFELEGMERPALLEPGDTATVASGSVVTFAWTAVSGASQYGFEFTGTNRQFANPNGATPDGANGFGGAGGGFLVAATTLTLTLPTDIPAGTYQVRVIGVSGQGLLGTFSDAVTIVVGTGTTTALQ